MSDVSIIGANSPLSAYVKFILNGFTTGEIPPKYILSFEVEKIKDMTGKFSLTLLCGGNTFKQGDDYLGIKLAALFNHINTTPSSDTNNSQTFTIPCTLEYGWSGTGIKVSYKQAVITGFSESIEDGAFIQYSISGTLSKSSSRASQTKIVGYDINDDGNVDIRDLIAAKKNNKDLVNNVNNYLLGKSDQSVVTTTPETARSIDKILPGSKLSNNIEVLAKYIFKDIYNVIVDHTDAAVEKDTAISSIIKNTNGQKANESLYNKLCNMVDNCFSISGYNIKYEYTTPFGNNTFEEFVESNQNIEERKYYFDEQLYNEYIYELYNYSYDLSAEEKSKKEREIKEKTTYEIKSVSKEPVNGERFQMFFIDGDGHKYGRPTLRICPKSATNNNAKFAHYTISNTNRYNNAVRYSHNTNLIPLVTAFNSIFGNSSSDVDIDTGGFIFTSIQNLGAQITKDNADSYAQEYALSLIKNLDNVTEADLDVVFDRYSILLGIDDRLSITNTVNGGNTLFNGEYYITSATDSLDGGLLKTSYKLKYTKSDIEKYVKDKVLQLMYELIPSLNKS